MLKIFRNSISKLRNLTRFHQTTFFSSIPEINDKNITLNEGQNAWSYELSNDKIKGIKYNPIVGNYVMMYTCGVCQHRQSRSFSKSAYHEGVVIVRCESCEKHHLIADNLKWFDDFTQNIEQIMEKTNNKVVKINADADLQRILIARMKPSENEEQIQQEK